MKLSKSFGLTSFLGASCLLMVTFGANAESIENLNNQNDVIRSAPFANCTNIDNDQIAVRVKNDYLQNRLPRWQDDKKLLGSKPVANINANEVVKNGNNYQVTLGVRGARTDLRYNVAVNCDDNTITYTLSK